MKIAILLERAESWRGGAETSIQQYAHALLNHGLEVHLVTASRGYSAGPLQWETVRARGPTKFAQSAAFVRSASRLIREQRFDVVHAVTPVPGANVYQPRGGMIAETQHRNAVIRRSLVARSLKRLTYRLSPKQMMLKRLEAKVVLDAAAPIIVAVSQYVARQVRDYYDLPAERVRVVFNAVDVDSLDRIDRGAARAEVCNTYRIPRDAVIMLAVAHNFKLKGIGQLVRAAAMLVGRRDLPELRVLVVGRDNPVRYQVMAEKLGANTRVIFTGPTERIAWFYGAADVLVHPTFYDPCSRVVLEALAMGLPCITTRHNGAAEIMVDGRHGFVIDSPHDVGALADRMARLCDRRLRAECSAHARSVREIVDMKRHVQEMLKVYETVRSRRT